MAGITFPNSRMASIQMSGGIREILSKADMMEKQGRSIIHMEIGRPDFDSPECAKKAAAEALNNGDVHYTDMAGKYELREALAEKYKRVNSIDADPDLNFVIKQELLRLLLHHSSQCWSQAMRLSYRHRTFLLMLTRSRLQTAY